MPSPTENSSSGAKSKRKSRRRRTMSPGTNLPEETERSQMEFEPPRERSHRSRRIHRDISKEDTSSTSSRRRTSNTSSQAEAGSSRRTPTHSHHRHAGLSGASPSLVTPSSKRRPEQPVVAQDVSLTARRNLTSSGSSIRPSNRKRLDESHFTAVDSSYRFGGRQRSSGNNNDAEFEEENQHLTFGRLGAGPEHFPTSGQEDWLTSSGNNNNNNNSSAAARVTLPSRASKYRNLSAGANKKSRTRAAVVPAKDLTARPPSRQRHAFPTHLIDANAFDAPETGGRGGSSSSSTSSSRSRCDPSSAPEGTTIDRPPSRYMVKAKRNSKQGPSHDPSAPSRRCVVYKNVVFSCNQAHHDPKTDGFADVDESVPPPFRIEVTTDTSESALDSPAETRSTPPSSGNVTKNPRNDRRWSLSNQEQLLRMAVRGCDGSRGSDQTMSADLDAGQSPLQWFGKDDQINNAHLFETIISMPSPRTALESDVDVAIEDDLEDSDGPQYHRRKIVSKQQQPQHEPHHHIENHFPSRRAAAASKLAAPTTTISVADKSDLQWIRSSTNPFFVGSSTTVDYDAMDPDTAIEQTPLYTSDDLMTLAATEMTDLHLDDYTALGDASIPAPPPLVSGMGWGGSRLLPGSRSPPLRTSLGKDFLSLFAQH
ncbi:unnamed protein product [Phytophthora fragariaefolia]|uniref:Unnamed protein product n=1 Tax=Phytophthora fragariaefolia TaxID=1490495 RepID=A0A9W6WKQ3_9STRA|nr:unnamed protein product [Phytophthora fragariaefolia]